MFGTGIRARTLAVCALAGAVPISDAHASRRSLADGSRGDWPRVLIHDPPTRWALYGALQGAARWLERPGCRGLFTAFRDRRGRPLAEKLSDFGVDPGGYLKLIVFADGRDLASCRRGSVLAVTMPGSRVVFVCGREFTRAWSRHSRHATAVPLHEALHSLGLAEDPPTSAEIDAEVLRRCGP
jgi:hypothetical protein